MNLKDIILTANSNLLRSKLRTILTVIAIFIGAFTLTLTSGLGSGISSYIDKQVNNIGQADDIIITAKSPGASGPGGSDEPQKYEPGKLTSSNTSTAGPPVGATIVLTDKDIDILKANKDLKNVQPSYAVNPDYIQSNNGKQYKLTSSTVGANANLDLAAGKQLLPNSADNQLVLPLGYVKPLGFSSLKDSIGQKVTIAVTDATGFQHIVKATIVGVQQKGLASSRGIVFNNTLINILYDLQSTGLPAASKGKYQSATAKIVGKTTEEHVSSVKSTLESQGYKGQTLEDQLGTFKAVINIVTYVLIGFSLIALLAASFGIVNTLLMSVQERTKEIGLMKAMGMHSNRIFTLFSLEAILIGFWGSALGIGVAMSVGKLVNMVVADGLLKNLPGFSLLTFKLQSSALIILLIMGIAFIAGTLPARRAAKQNPIDALRYE